MSVPIYPRALYRQCSVLPNVTPIDPWLTTKAGFAERTSNIQWMSVGDMNGRKRRLQVRAKIVNAPGTKPIRTFSEPEYLPAAPHLLGALQVVLLGAMGPGSYPGLPIYSPAQDDLLGGVRIDLDDLTWAVARRLSLSA